MRRFLDVATSWRALKSATGPEERNRALLRQYAEDLTKTMKTCFGEEVDKHLTMLARQLAQKQDQAYDRMRNNCQTFCNALLSDHILGPMYPFYSCFTVGEHVRKAEPAMPEVHAEL
jgi:protoheme ferro-lyase